jgi:rhodanese-related sulfurtransferase
VRSLAAAEAARAAGYAAVFNIADGFEGPLDAAGHRGTRAGWKAAGLPWQQR